MSAVAESGLLSSNVLVFTQSTGKFTYLQSKRKAGIHLPEELNKAQSGILHS